MPNYLTRKKTLMGKRYEVEVPLEQYGGDIVRVHAVPDMTLARIEDRTSYKLEDAIAALSSQNLTEEEIELLKAGGLTETDAATEAREVDQENATDEPKATEPSPELILKASKALSPKLTLFLGELCKAGIVPDPGCTCKGKGCPDCDVSQMVEEFRGFSVLMVGMAIIGASTTSWEEIEDFFSRPKEPSGLVSPA